MKVSFIGCTNAFFGEAKKQWNKPGWNWHSSGARAVCELPAEFLEDFYGDLAARAEKHWTEKRWSEEVLAPAVLQFESVFFPKSGNQLLPMRQIQGGQARHRRYIQHSLQPTSATPAGIRKALDGPR